MTEEEEQQRLQEMYRRKAQVSQQVVEHFFRRYKDQLAKIAYRHKVPEQAVKLVAALTITGSSRQEVREHMCNSQFPQWMAGRFGRKGVERANRSIDRSERLVDEIMALAPKAKPRAKRPRKAQR